MECWSGPVAGGVPVGVVLLAWVDSLVGDDGDCSLRPGVDGELEHVGAVVVADGIEETRPA